VNSLGSRVTGSLPRGSVAACVAFSGAVVASFAFDPPPHALAKGMSRAQARANVQRIFGLL
jgi:hypothetical protein